MFYLLNKPKGISSFQAIKSFARAQQIKKIGHTGTLDPLASGLLLVATDDDTRLIEYIDKSYKTYEATMVLGSSTTTYDAEGEVTNTSDQQVTIEQVQSALLSFVGKYKQLPPQFSAKRIDGVRAYDLARNGQHAELQPVLVEIKAIEDMFLIDKNTYRFTVAVSRGTYIRSLIHDVGIKLGTYAHMSDLIRTQIGNLALVKTWAPVDVRQLLELPIIILDQIQALRDGKQIQQKASDGIYALEYQQEIIGIGKVANGILKSEKLLGNKIAKKVN